MDDASARYLDHQARLTQNLRRHIYRQIALPRLGSALDIGCGGGAITAEIAQRGLNVVGIDTDAEAITRAQQTYRQIDFRHVSDGRIPFDNESFGLAFCHFLLMWQTEPLRLLSEMKRVVRSGGYVVVAAEPDYGGRVSDPDDGLSAPLAQAQQSEGADPCVGRRLRGFFVQAGLDAQVNVWPSMVPSPSSEEEFNAEWNFYHRTLPDKYLGLERTVAKDADVKGMRTVFLPLFYAIARR